MLKSIKLSSVKVFSLMFGVIFLLNLNYTILKSARRTLAVADLGGSAISIPFFELFGTLPAALLMTYLLTKILKKMSLKRVFISTMTIFTIFFFLFAAIYYPKLILLQKSIATPYLLKGSSMAFYVMGELWKPTLIQILFLGFINLNLSMDEAKSMYPSLMLGASLGAVVAGPLTVFCNSKLLWKLAPINSSHWNNSLILMMLVVLAVGLISSVFFMLLSNSFPQQEKPFEKENSKFSLKEAISFFFQSKPLRLMGWIVFADYIAYSLAEILFLEVLKLKYPLPTDYCTYMGYLSLWHSALTVLSALILAPFVLKKTKWITSAIILPIGLLCVEGIFFFTVVGKDITISLLNLSTESYLSLVVAIGSILYCSCRAIKYTLFDPCKELAFIQMPKSSRMKGKIIIDGLCSKFGRGASSATAIYLTALSGSLLASATLSSVVALSVCISLIFATSKLGNQLDTPELASI
ncbi:MAG: ADP,ATP carrier protein 1 [Chlamydiia bacterium]|nr:ADP,ATP carrier protein 1 [Chlamydiia bacterium]